MRHKHSAYCSIEYQGSDPVYRVYDHTGALLCYTHSRSVAGQMLELAQKGISARLYYFLEYYNWKIPKRFLDRL